MTEIDRKIHIYWEGKSLSLLDEDDKTPLYAVELNWASQPQLEIIRLGSKYQSNYTAGTVTFSPAAGFIDISLHGRPVRLSRKAFYSQSRVFESSQGQLCWENDGRLTTRLRLVDMKGNLYAKHVKEKFSRKKEGVFEARHYLVDETLDEVVVSGLAMILQQGSPNIALNAPVGLIGTAI